MNDNNNNDIIMPYCIYHYIDTTKNKYFGNISNPIKYRHNNKDMFKCSDNKLSNSPLWYKYKTFYAISPMFRPIPSNMRLFCFKQNKNNLQETIQFSVVYDMFNIYNNCVYFISYNQPVPNTEPLYIHKNKNTIFPSFNYNPPSLDKNWTQTELSPIFVMTSNTMGNDISKFKFNCVNERCIPWNISNNINDIYYDKKYNTYFDLPNCSLQCTEFVDIVDKSRPFDILKHIKSVDHDNKNENMDVKSISSKNKNYTISIIFMFLFIFFLFIIILYFFR